MNERDLKILKHIGLYRVSIRVVIEKAFFSGASCGNVLKRLIREQLITTGDDLPGPASYYQLTRKGAALVGFPAARATHFEPQSLQKHLAILSFCFLGKRPRHRMDESILKTIFRQDTPSGDHCLEETSNERKGRIYHVQVTGLNTSTKSLVRQTREKILKSLEEVEQRAWIESREYAFAILVDNELRADAVKQAFKNVSDKLHQQAAIYVEAVPSFNLFKGVAIAKRAKQ